MVRLSAEGGRGNSLNLLESPREMETIAKARKYLSEGKLNDIVILGDREIAKWPANAKAIKKFLKSQF